MGGATTGAVAVGLVSSVVQLGRKPLWVDEAFSLGATNQLGRTLRDTAGTMAAYYVLLDGWTALFGTTPRALRSLSVVLCLVALVVVALVARRLLGPVEAAATVLVAAGLPGLSRIAQDARSYALVLLVTAGCWLVLARAVATDGPDARPWRWWLALAPLVVVGELAQGLFLLQVAAMAASLLVGPGRWGRLLRLAPAIAAGTATLAALVALGAGDVGDWIPPLTADQLPPVAQTFLGYETWAAAVLGALALGGLAVLARRALAGPDDGRWAAAALLAWAVVPPVLLVGLSLARPALLGRYVLGSLPGLAALVAVGAVTTARALARVVPRGRVLRLAPGAVVVIALAATLVVARASRTEVPYERWDEAAALLAVEARPGDGLVFSHADRGDQARRDTARAPFEAAWATVDHPVVPVTLSPARPLGQVRRFDDLTPPAELARRMVGHARVWVVGFRSFWRSARDLLAVRPAAGAFRRARVIDIDGIQIVLLVRR